MKKCNFCSGNLGRVQHQKHSNPDFASYRSCIKCGYQWAKKYTKGEGVGMRFKEVKTFRKALKKGKW